jgi:hypothetical protein
MKVFEHVLNTLRKRTLKSLIPNLLEKVDFLASKTLQSPLRHRGEKIKNL